MNYKVSIIIPLFNRENLIIETLKSLYSQSYKNWEAIIVDDGSKDNSLNVIKNEAEKDSRINVFVRQRKPKGAPTCRNIGIEKATGNYIIFLDSDDILAPYCLEERVTYFQKYPYLDYLVFNGAFFNEKIGDTNILWNKFTKEDDLTRFYSGEPVWSMIGGIWKKKSLIKHNLLFDEMAKTSQDWEFHIKALQKKMQYKKIDILSDYFVRRSSKQAVNAISSQHGNKDKFLNRLDVFTILFYDNRKLTKQHKYQLFKNLYFQLFSVYTDFSFIEINKVFKKIEEMKFINNTQIKFWQLFIKVFLFLHKKGVMKAKIAAYFISKAILVDKGNKNWYRSKMDPDLYHRLKIKLDEKH